MCSSKEVLLQQILHVFVPRFWRGLRRCLPGTKPDKQATFSRGIPWLSLSLQMGLLDGEGVSSFKKPSLLLVCSPTVVARMIEYIYVCRWFAHHHGSTLLRTTVRVTGWERFFLVTK